MTWQEGLARALIALLATFALFVVLTPHGSDLLGLDGSQPVPVRSWSCASHAPALCSTPHR